MLIRLVTILSLAVALAGCGGGSSSGASSSGASQSATRSELVLLPRSAQQSAPLVHLTTRVPSADELMDWAEAAYPQHFPGHESDRSLAPYVYRYYAQTGNKLGLDPSGDVYVLGPVSGGVLQRVANVSELACSVHAAECLRTEPVDTVELPLQVKPFGTVAIRVDDDFDPRDRFYVKYWSVDGSTEQLLAREGNLLYVSLPGGVPGNTGQEIFSPGPVGFSIVQKPAAGGSARSSHYSVDVPPLPVSPYKPGALIILMAQLQNWMTAMGGSEAVSAGVLTQSQFEAYRGHTSGDASYLRALDTLSAEQVVQVERVLYAYFLAAGVTLKMKSAPLSSGPLKFVPFATASEDFDVVAIARDMAGSSRDLGRRMSTAGAILVGAGLAVNVVPIAAIGATAVMVGLLAGTTNSLVFDNAGLIAGDRSSGPNLLETVKYFASSVLASALSVANVAGNRAVEALIDDRKYLSAFAADRAMAFGIDEFADGLVSSAAAAYQSAARHASGYLSALPAPSTGRDPGGSTPGGGPAPGGGKCRPPVADALNCL